MKSLTCILLLITSFSSSAGPYRFSWGEISLFIVAGTTFAPTNAILTTFDTTSDALTNNKLEHAMIIKDSINIYHLTNEMSPLLSSAVYNVKNQITSNQSDLTDEDVIDIISISLEEVFNNELL